MGDDKKKKIDILNNRENSEGESIYGKFRQRILDEKEKEIVGKVQGGAQSGYTFEENGDDSLSGEYVGKVDKKRVFIYVTVSTIILTSLIFLIYSMIPDPEDKFRKYRSLIAEVERLNVKKSQKMIEIEKIIEELTQSEDFQGIELDPSDERFLTDESLRYLSELAGKESDADIQTKISTIIQTDQEVRALQQDITSKIKGLEPPVRMTRTKGHEQIAIEFLGRKGVNRQQAKDLVESVNIFDYTYEGLYVWNFYEKGFYGSFVTRGEADKSPHEIKQLAQQAFQERILDLERERSASRSMIQQLENELRATQAERDRLLAERERPAPTSDRGSASTREDTQRESSAHANSLNYALLTYQFAIDRGIITDSAWEGVRMGRITDLDFNYRVDFSVTDHLILRPRQFGMSSFEEIYVLPRSLVSSGDIRVLKREQISRIEFLNRQNLLQKEILIIAK